MFDKISRENAAAIVLGALSFGCGPSAPHDQLKSTKLEVGGNTFEYLGEADANPSIPSLTYELPEAERKALESIRDLSLSALTISGRIVEQHNNTGTFIEPEELRQIAEAGKIAATNLESYLQTRFTRPERDESDEPLVFIRGTVSPPETDEAVLLKSSLREGNFSSFYALHCLSDLADSMNKGDAEAVFIHASDLIVSFDNIQREIEFRAKL